MNGTLYAVLQPYPTLCSCVPCCAHACRAVLCHAVQLRTYVNGTLYSVLQQPAVRHAARLRGTGDLLEAVAAASPPMFAAQVNGWGCLWPVIPQRKKCMAHSVDGVNVNWFLGLHKRISVNDQCQPREGEVRAWGLSVSEGVPQQQGQQQQGHDASHATAGRAAAAAGA